jgi:hypothetical protein
MFAHGAGVGRGKAAVLVFEETFLDALAIHGREEVEVRVEVSVKVEAGQRQTVCSRLSLK